MSSKLFSLCLPLFITVVQGEDKWVWSKEKSSGLISSDSSKVSVAKAILNDLEVDPPPRRKVDDLSELAKYLSDEEYRKARYEVQEHLEYQNGRPVGPLPVVNARPVLPNRPAPDRQDNYIPLPSNIDPGVRQQQSPQSVGILTGPVPSWEKPILHKNGDPTKFDNCKCSFAFNCKSPGIQFGSCDQGKQYCCFNEFTPKDGTPAASSYGGFGSIDRYDKHPSVLAGPGGPVDHRPAVLAGPGGPVDHRPARPIGSYGPTSPPRGHIYRPEFEELDGLDALEFNRRPSPIIPQKPVLPPYIGLHHDHRSS